MKIALDEIQRHDHACVSFHLDTEFIDYAFRNVQTAVRRHECGLVIAPALLQERISERLALAGLDPERLLATGQLNFISPDAFYLAGGSFDADRIIEGVERSIQGMLRKGFSGLRGIGGVYDAVAEGKIDPVKLIAYEIKAQALFHQYPVSGICAYRRPSIPDSLYDQIVQIHPYQVLRTLSLS